MRSFLFTAFIVFFFFNLLGAGNWSTQKTENGINVCYQAASGVYCANSTDKRTKEKDLKQFLSVFLQFGDKNVSKNDMLIHPGIQRLVRSSRLGEGRRILKGVHDFLTREAKRKKISISEGKETLSEKEQKTVLDEIQWYNFVTVSAEQIGCTPSEEIKVSLSITNSLKKDLSIKRDEVELRIMSTGNQLMTVGSINAENILIKQGQTEEFIVTIQMTGDMDPAMGYQLVPIIKNVDVLKDKPYVRCKK